MNVRTFMIIAAVVAALFGLGFMLIPDSVMSIFGVQINDSERFICRYLGSALFGIAVTWWVLRAVKTLDEALIGVAFGAATLSLTGFVIGLWDAISGTGNGLVWIIPVIYILLSIGFVYAYLSRKKKAAKS